MKYKVGLLLFTFTAIASSRDIAYPLEPPVGSNPDPVADEPVNSYEGFYSQYATIIGEKWVKGPGLGDYSLVAKGVSTANHVSDFYSSVEPLSQNALSVGTQTDMPFVSYNEMSGLLSAKLPALGMGDIAITPKYIAPGKSSPVDNLDPFAGKAGQLGVGWHFGLGHLVVSRRPIVERVWQGDDGTKRCSWQAQGYENIWGVDSSGRESKFAKQYLSLPESVFEDANGVKRHYVFPGSSRHSNVQEGVHAYYSKARESSLVNSAGSVLTREQSSDNWQVHPPAKTASNPNCDLYIPAQSPNEAKVLTKNEQNQDNWFQEYGWFDYTMHQPDGAKVIYRAELESLEKANQVATKTVEGTLSDQVKMTQQVYFHPVEIIQPNGVAYVIEYEGESLCASSGYSHCIGSRKIKSIKKKDASSAKSPQLLFAYTEQGLIDSVQLRKDNTTVTVAQFGYTHFDGQPYLSSFSDAEDRQYKLFYENTTYQGTRWLTGVASPLSNATTASDATTYIQYDFVDNVPVGAYFPRGCSMRPATIDYRVTGVYIDGINQWSLDTLDDPNRDEQEASCDPVLYGASNYNPRRVNAIKSGTKTVSFSYNLIEDGEDAENPNHEVTDVQYALLRNNVNAINHDKNFSCHTSSDYPCINGDGSSLKVDALYRVEKQVVDDSQSQKTTTYYASYGSLYDYPASRKMGQLAGKPLVQITQVKNDAATAEQLGSDYKDTVRKEWYWDFVDVWATNVGPSDFDPGTFGGNPVSRKFTAKPQLVKQATAVYSGNYDNPLYMPTVNNVEANYTLYNYGGIKLGVDGQSSPPSFTSTRLKAMFGKPKSVYSISKKGVEPDSFYHSTYEKTVSELKYTSNYSFSIGNDDFSVYQMMLPVAKTVCQTRGNSCDLNDSTTRLISKTDTHYQQYQALNGLYLPAVSNSYRDGTSNGSSGPGAITTSFQYFTSNGGAENKGMLKDITKGGEVTSFFDYFAGQPAEIKKADWNSGLRFDHTLNAGGFTSHNYSRSGAQSTIKTDLLGRTIAEHQAGFLGSQTHYSEVAGSGLTVTEQLEQSSPHSYIRFDHLGRKTSEERKYTENSDVATTRHSVQGLGLYHKTNNAKGGVIETYSDILGRPVLTRNSVAGNQYSETRFHYDLVESVANDAVSYKRVSDKQHQVFYSSVFDLGYAEHATSTETNLIGEVVAAKQCNSLTTNCASDNVEVAYESVNYSDPHFGLNYQGVTKQTTTIKSHQNGESFGERISISDLLGNLIYEKHPEIGERYYLYDEKGRLLKSKHSDGIEVSHTYQGDLLKKVVFHNPNDVQPDYIVLYHHDAANDRLIKTESYYEGDSRKVVEWVDYQAQSDKLAEKTITIPSPVRGPQDLRPRYIEDYSKLGDSLTLRWNSGLANANFQIELTNKTLSDSQQTQSVIFDNILANSFELTSQKLINAITTQLGSDSTWLDEFNVGANPILPSSTYEWRVLGYDSNTYEPFASSQKSVLTNECQILEFEAVKGFQQGPLIKWDTRGCEGLTTAVLVTTHTVAKNNADLNDDCRIDDGVFSGYKRGPQRAHFLYNGYNKPDIIAAEEGDSSQTPVWTGEKQCFGSPTNPAKRLEEVTFRLSVREGGSGLIKDQTELMSSRNIIARLDYDQNACHIRNFQVKHGSGELAYDAMSGTWSNQGNWTAPSATWEAVNCENKFIELSINAIDTKCPVNELIGVEQSGTHMAETLAACGNKGGATFQLEVRDAANFEADVIDQSQTLEAMNMPQVAFDGSCYISDFTATDGDDQSKPTVTWNTFGCDDKKVSVLYNAVQPGVSQDCQLRDYTFIEETLGQAVPASFMYKPYTVNSQGQRVDAAHTDPSACAPMTSADVWLEVREKDTGALVADTPPLDVAYTGQWESSCQIEAFNIVNSSQAGQLPTVNWTTSCGSDVSVRVLTTVTGSADAQCDLNKQLWDGNKSGGREVTFMLGGYANNCPPVEQASFEVHLVNPVDESIIATSEVKTASFTPDGDFAKACEVTNLSVTDRGAGLLPSVNVSLDRTGCTSTQAKVMYQPIGENLSEQCRAPVVLQSIYSSYSNLLEKMLGSNNCPAVSQAKVWVEQFDNNKLIAHSSYVDAQYQPESQCAVHAFNVANSSVPGELPVVSWETNCSGQSVQVKTSSVTLTEPSQCNLDGALWDGNKSLRQGRTVDFMVGGWGVTPSHPWGCPAMAQADFWIEIYDGGVLTERTPTKRAQFNPVASPCHVSNDSFYVEGAGAGNEPKVHYYTNCSANDATVHVMFSFSGDNTRHELYNMQMSGTNGLDIYKLQDISGRREGWVWIEIRDSSANKNLLRRTDYKKADFGMALNSQSLTTVDLSKASENNL